VFFMSVSVIFSDLADLTEQHENFVPSQASLLHHKETPTENFAIVRELSDHQMIERVPDSLESPSSLQILLL